MKMEKYISLEIAQFCKRLIFLPTILELHPFHSKWMTSLRSSPCDFIEDESYEAHYAGLLEHLHIEDLAILALLMLARLFRPGDITFHGISSFLVSKNTKNSSPLWIKGIKSLNSQPPSISSHNSNEYFIISPAGPRLITERNE